MEIPRTRGSLNEVGPLTVALYSFSYRSGQAPVIGEAVMAGMADDEVVQHVDTENVGGLLQTCGQLPVLGAGRVIAGRVVVRAEKPAGVHQDEGLADFARVNDGHGERADRDG